MLFFKILADIFIMLYLGVCISFGLFRRDFSNLFLNHLTSLDLFLIIPLLIYSLFGVFGFWIYWAMEASHYISSYLHSVGFIAIGVVVLNKLYYTKVLEEAGYITNIILVTSLLNFIIFLVLSLETKDLKKSYGYFSSSSISCLFIYTIISPTLCSFYLVISSFIKIISFTLLGYVGKQQDKPNSKGGNHPQLIDWGFIWVLEFLFYTINLNITHQYLKGSGVLVDLLEILFVLKVSYLVVFFIRMSYHFVGLSSYQNNTLLWVGKWKRGLFYLVLSFYTIFVLTHETCLFKITTKKFLTQVNEVFFSITTLHLEVISLFIICVIFMIYYGAKGIMSLVLGLKIIMRCFIVYLLRGFYEAFILVRKPIVIFNPTNHRGFYIIFPKFDLGDLIYYLLLIGVILFLIYL